MNKSSNEWEQDNPPQSSSPSLFVQEAEGPSSNQHFNLASWHYQFTDRLVSFVLLWIQFYLKASRPSLFLSVAFCSPVNETLPIYSTVASFTSSFCGSAELDVRFVSEHCWRSTSREFSSSHLSALRACSQLTTPSLRLSPPFPGCCFSCDT